ncbi:MAG: EAL domain-containing protein [Oscillospiraceae bacterium]|nr:EAL domain-containing protein [Oscillospiraceae bacterium]
MVIYTNMAFGIILSALLICLTDLLFTVLDGHTGKPQNRVYIIILLLLSASAVCEMINECIGDSRFTSDRAFSVIKTVQYFYFLCHTLIAPMLYYYISFVVGRSVGSLFLPKKSSLNNQYLQRIFPVFIIIVTEIIIAVNPLTHWCWYFKDRVFHRAPGEYYLIYSFSAVWIIASFVLVMQSWNILSKGRKRSIGICFLLATAGVIIQMVYREWRVEVLMEALGLTGVLLFIENEDDRKNVELNAYNSAAFSLDLTAAVKNRNSVKVLIIRTIRFDRKANTIVSVRISRDAISRAVSDYLGTVVKRYYLYVVSGSRFALTLFNQTEEEAFALAQKICDRFQQPWTINGTDMILSARLLLVRVPEDAKTADEIVYMARCPIPETMTEPVISGQALAWMVRRAAVEKAVTRGLDENSFEVYYQPTYNMDKTLHGAEALLRMRDKDMGMIYPDEFIPIAEQIGLIDHLDEFVLREVCKFISTGIPRKNGMDCINVNLSVLECMKEGFVEYVSEIVDAAGVQRNMINFEITESVAAKDYDHLAQVIARLREKGFQFSIDDYGTGYSNMSSLFSLGVDIIKIDKSILWNAEHSDSGMTLLKVSIELVHKMEKKALMEGVETEAHIKILKELGCEYLQGFYFSKPLPKTAFVALIEGASQSPA